MYYAYLRVSTEEQNNDRQEIAVLKYAQEKNILYTKLFQDHVSGKTFNRPEYQNMKAILKTGDAVIVKDISRLGRNWEENKTEWKWFLDNNIGIVVLDTMILSTDEGVLTLDMKLVKEQIFTLMCYLAQKERELISQRTKEGLAAVKSKGKKLGAPRTYSAIFIKEAYEHYKNAEGATLMNTAELYGINYVTLSRRFKELKEGEKTK